MKKQLYEVEITMYVMATDEENAKQVAIHEAGYELDMCDIDAHEAKSYYQSWKNAIPFGSDDDKTVGEIFKEKRKEHDP